MDPNILHLAFAGGLTLVLVIITALLWRSAQVKTVFWWIGLCLVPMAVYLAGLAPAVVGAYDTLRLWWGTLSFTPVVWTGLVLGGLAAALMLGSRMIPSESYRDRRAAKKAAKSGAVAPGKGTSAAGAVGRGASGTAVAPRPSPAASSPAPAAAPAPRPAAGSGATSGSGAASGTEDFDEVADILRKRGIS